MREAGKVGCEMEKSNVYELPYHWCLHGFYKYYYEQKYTLCRPYLKATHIVLDLGGGDGRLAFLISRHVRRVFCADKQYRPLTFGRLITSESGAPVTFLAMNALALSFASETFDVVTLFDVIEHILPDEVPFVLREIWRVLKTGGLLVLTTPNRLNLRARIWGHRPNPKHYCEYTIPEVVQKLAVAGFEPKNISGLYLVPPLPRAEVLANQYPFRPVFQWLVRLGRYRPDLSETMMVFAEKLPRGEKRP